MNLTLTSSQKEMRTRYQEDGYFFASRFFTAEEINSLEIAIRSSRERSSSSLNRKGLIFREYLHRESPLLQQFISQPKIIDFLKNFIGPDFWLRKDQAVSKEPAGVEFGWHQDNGYNGLFDAYCQFWVPLTPMHPDNGGLFIIPKSHRNGILPHHYRNSHFVWEGDVSGMIPIRAERGDVMVFSSLLLHRTGPNNTERNRIAYVAEFMSSEHYDPFAKPPFFQVAKNGTPDPRFVRFYRGNLSLNNRLKYVIPLTRRNYSIWKGRAGKFIRQPFNVPKKS